MLSRTRLATLLLALAFSQSARADIIEQYRRFLSRPDPILGDTFGRSVAVDGDTLVVGAPGAAPHGSVYVFYRNQNGTDAWGYVTTIPMPDNINGSFGSAVGISGDTVVASAPTVNNGTAYVSGAIYVFGRNIGGPDHWGLIQRRSANTPQTDDRFGQALAINGDHLPRDRPST